MIAIVLGIILLAMFLADQQDFEESPIYYSPWLVPVYKYDTQLNDVVSHLTPVGVLLGFVSLLLLWSLVATAELRPIWILLVYYYYSLNLPSLALTLKADY